MYSLYHVTGCLEEICPCSVRQSPDLPNSVHGFLGFNWRCLRGEVRWESLRRDLGVIPERILGSGRECKERRRFFFLNLRQKSLLYGNIIPHNSFFEIINLKIFVDSCGISAQSLLLRLNASDICSSNKVAAALHPASCFLSLSSGWLIHVLLTMCATESKFATQIWV